MKILIEIPDNWLDERKLNNLGFITRTCKEELQKILMDVAKEKLLSDLKIPEITIDREELKQAILNEMVERKLNED